MLSIALLVSNAYLGESLGCCLCCADSDIKSWKWLFQHLCHQFPKKPLETAQTAVTSPERLVKGSDAHVCGQSRVHLFEQSSNEFHEHFFTLKLWKWTKKANVGRFQWHPTPVLLPGKSLGWRSLVGCSPWDH